MFLGGFRLRRRRRRQPAAGLQGKLAGTWRVAPARTLPAPGAVKQALMAAQTVASTPATVPSVVMPTVLKPPPLPQPNVQAVSPPASESPPALPSAPTLTATHEAICGVVGTAAVGPASLATTTSSLIVEAPAEPATGTALARGGGNGAVAKAGLGGAMPWLLGAALVAAALFSRQSTPRR